MGRSLEAKITLSYENVRDAEAVAQAVSPDNLKVPLGLVVETKRRGSRVITLIKCEKGLSTFIATIDDLLSCVSVAERTCSVAKVR